MAVARRTVDLARTLRSANRLKTRQPLARAWLARAGARRRAGRGAPGAHRRRDQRQGRRADRRRLRPRRASREAAPARGSASAWGPPSPRSWPRLARATPTFHDDGSVTLAGEHLAADEVEIQATPRPGTVVADDDGLVMILDIELTARAARRGRRPRARPGDPGAAPRGRARARRPDRAVGRRRCPDDRRRPPAGGRGATRWPPWRRGRRPTTRIAPVVDARRAGRSRSPCGGPRDRDRDDAARRPRRRREGRPRWLLFFGLAAAVIVVDQLSKAWLVSAVDPGEAIRVIGDYLRLIYSQNSGALFGLFRDQAILFGLVSVGVVGAHRLVPRRVRPEHAAVDRARAAARWRHRQHDRPVPLRLRRRLGRRRHRRPALLHVQRRRFDDHACRSCC